MGQYYGKEINNLRFKVQESNSMLDKFKESKTQIQDNLKKALMRGVVAMNLEAMNILEPESIANLNSLSNNIANLNTVINNNETQSNKLNNNLNLIESFENKNILDNNNNDNDEDMYFSNIDKKVISKDNNWINACAVSNKVKHELINKNEFEEDDPKYYINNKNNYYNQDTLDKLNNYSNNRGSNYFDELTKSI